MLEKIIYPFTAIVGQEEMKLALILNLINPALGGVLIRGEKGTAKSTAVRSLCNLLDEVEIIEGCAFHCRPGIQPLCAECREKKEQKTIPYTRRVVELPISATEDRVVGALNIERAVKKGERVFEPGILAEANGNILYVICWMTISWMCCWTAPQWALIRWSGKVSPTAIRRILCWWEP